MTIPQNNAVLVRHQSKCIVQRQKCVYDQCWLHVCTGWVASRERLLSENSFVVCYPPFTLLCFYFYIHTSVQTYARLYPSILISAALKKRQAIIHFPATDCRQQSHKQRFLVIPLTRMMDETGDCRHAINLPVTISLR
jgi:hypothetical protein